MSTLKKKVIKKKSLAKKSVTPKKKKVAAPIGNCTGTNVTIRFCDLFSDDQSDLDFFKQYGTQTASFYCEEDWGNGVVLENDFTDSDHPFTADKTSVISKR